MPIQKKNELFTQTLDEQTAATVRRIAGKHKKFATDFIGPVADDGSPMPSARLEAWENPETKLWKIERFTHVPGADGGVVKQEDEARPGLCFFDALYHLSRFQSTELEGRNAQVVTVPGARWSNTPHYRDAADAAGQVIDAKDGLARPCAYGRMLTEGFVTESDWDIVLKTEGMALSDRAANDNFLTRSMLDDVLTATTPLAGTEEQWIAAANRKQQVIDQLQKVSASGDAWMKNFQEIYRRSFKTDFTIDKKADSYDRLTTSTKAFLKTTFSFGLVPVIGVAQGNPRYSVNRSFLSLKESFCNAAEALPDCPEKTLSREFARSAEVAFWMERAAAIASEHQNGNRKSIDEGMEFIEKAATADGLSAIDLQRLKNEYTDGALQKGSFIKKTQSQWNGGGRWDYDDGRDVYGNRVANSLTGRLGNRIQALQSARKQELPAVINSQLKLK